MTRQRNLSPAAVEAFWNELASIEKTASTSEILAGLLRLVRAHGAADVVSKRGKEMSDAFLEFLLKERPELGPRILPRKTIKALADMVSENPHTIPLVVAPVPGSNEVAVGGTVLAKKLLGVKTVSRPEREAILRAFEREEVPMAPWVRPMERLEDLAEDKFGRAAAAIKNWADDMRERAGTAARARLRRNTR